MKDKRNILFGIGIGAILATVILAVFLLGLAVGKRDSRFLPPRNFFPRDFNHGVMGVIESLGENTLVIREREGGLKTVLVDNMTQIRHGHTPINFSDLKKDEQVIILGEPAAEEEATRARLIRVMEMLDQGASRSGNLQMPRGKFRFNQG